MNRRAELPHGKRDEGEEGIARIGDPAWPLHAEEHHHDPIDEPVAGEKLPPQDRDGDARAKERGQIEQRAVERQAADALVEDEGDAKREAQLQRHREEHVGEGHRHRGGEFRIRRRDADVVRGADPARIAQEIEVREREVERHQGRPERQAEEADEPGQEKEIAVEARAPESAACGFLRRGRVFHRQSDRHRGRPAPEAFRKRTARRRPAGGVTLG